MLIALNAGDRRAKIIQEDCPPQTVLTVRRVVLTRSARTSILQAARGETAAGRGYLMVSGHLVLAIRVLISGAGIAGPTLAYWLSHYGFEVTIVEKAPRLRVGGYVIDFWGAGFDIADRMGILPELLQ